MERRGARLFTDLTWHSKSLKIFCCFEAVNQIGLRGSAGFLCFEGYMKLQVYAINLFSLSYKPVAVYRQYTITQTQVSILMTTGASYLEAGDFLRLKIDVYSAVHTNNNVPYL